MNKKFYRKLGLSILILCASFGVLFADECNCSRDVDGIVYELSWFSVSNDCCKGESGYAVVEGYDNGKYMGYYYISISDAIGFCGDCGV